MTASISIPYTGTGRYLFSDVLDCCHRCGNPLTALTEHCVNDVDGALIATFVCPECKAENHADVENTRPVRNDGAIRVSCDYGFRWVYERPRLEVSRV